MKKSTSTDQPQFPIWSQELNKPCPSVSQPLPHSRGKLTPPFTTGCDRGNDGYGYGKKCDDYNDYGYGYGKNNKYDDYGYGGSYDSDDRYDIYGNYGYGYSPSYGYVYSSYGNDYYPSSYNSYGYGYPSSYGSYGYGNSYSGYSYPSYSNNGYYYDEGLQSNVGASTVGASTPA